MDSVSIQMAVAQQPAQAAGAHLRLHGGEVGLVEIECRVEDRLAVITRAEHAIGHQHMEVDVAVEVTAAAPQFQPPVEYPRGTGRSHAAGTPGVEAVGKGRRTSGAIIGPPLRATAVAVAGTRRDVRRRTGVHAGRTNRKPGQRDLAGLLWRLAPPINTGLANLH
jgi:hypothetical protein